MKIPKLLFLLFSPFILFNFFCSTEKTNLFEQTEKGIREVIAQAGPSVVCVITKNQADEKIKLTGGVIVDSSHILTLENALDNTDQMVILLQDGRKIKDFNVVKTFCDFETNVSLIEVKEKNLKPAKLLSPPAEISIGTMGIALCNTQFSRGLLASTGIIGQSAIGGCDAYDSPLLTYTTDLVDELSGAPVFNSQGELIALVEGKIEESKHCQLLLPLSTYYKVKESLAKSEVIYRGWIGIRPQRFSQFERIFSTDSLPLGVLVERVNEQSPAFQSGIKAGDLIFECEGKKIGTSGELRKIITGTPVGSIVKFGLIRNNEKIYLPVKTEKLAPLNKGRKCPFREI